MIYLYFPLLSVKIPDILLKKFYHHAPKTTYGMKIMKRINSMGSHVVEGFQCKPEKLDKNKPIMFSSVHLFLCEGERCKGKAQKQMADTLRELVKKLGFDKGEHRIKITRTFCNGACRFGQFAYTYKNVHAKNFSKENAFTAWKEVHTWTESQWTELFLSLIKNHSTPSIDTFKVEQQIFPKENKS